jgi:hypothetical protein
MITPFGAVDFMEVVSVLKADEVLKMVLKERLEIEC